MAGQGIAPGDRVCIVPTNEVPNSAFCGMEGEVLSTDEAGPLSQKLDVLVVLDDYFEFVPFFQDECFVTSSPLSIESRS